MRKTIQSILVPYDGTSSSDKALKRSINVAKNHNAKIILLTCVREKFTFGFFKTKSDKKVLEKQKNQAKERIENIKESLKNLGISVKSKIIKCDIVSNTIVDYAKNEKVDLIVMGKTKLSTAAERMYYENTLESVFKNTPCSFLFVR